MIFDHISHIRLYSRSSRFVIMYTLIVEKDLLFCITNNEISVQEISRILSVKKNKYSIPLTVKISLQMAERRFFLPDSFILDENASNECSFIKIGGEASILYNYQKKC